jgi:hypothetical protein
MAIDSADKRRNVSRMMLHAVMGLSPSAGVDTADRVNAARAYVGFSYVPAPPAAAIDKRYLRIRLGHQGDIILRVR